METPADENENELIENVEEDHINDEINISIGLHTTNKIYQTLPIDKAIVYIDLLKDCYEVLSNDVNRIYGDVDFKDCPYDEETFITQDKIYKNALIDTIEYALDVMGRNKNNYCLYTSSSYACHKISWRFVLTDVKATRKTNKDFVVSLLPIFQEKQQRYTIIDNKLLDFDTSVYSKGQKMRMVGTSKPKENRPLIMVKGRIEDSFISYVDKNCMRIFDSEKEEQDTNQYSTTIKPSSTSLNELYDLLNIFPKKYLTTLKGNAEIKYGAFQIINAILNSYPITEELKECILKTIPRQDYHNRDDIKWINEVIKRYTSPPPNSKYLTIATLYYLVEDKKALEELRSKYKRKYYKEIVGYTLPNEWSLLDNHSDSNGYLKDLPTNFKSILVESHLGTGKTTQIKKLIKANPKASILVVSPRITFSQSMFNDYGEENGFKLYSDVKGELTSIKKLFIQLESLHRLENRNKYDYIILDEIESILKQASPSTTHKHYSTSIKTFERLITDSNNVIGMDAFITNRSIDMFNMLRPNPTLVRNNFNPYKRQAIEVPIKQLFSKNLEVLTNTENPKRCITISSSLKQLQNYEEVLKDAKIEYLSYHSEDDKKLRKLTLEDVNKSWADKKVKTILYTSSVSVGINYDNKKRPFSQIFMYASAGGSTPRDLFQGSLRARNLTDNLLTFCIDSRTPRPRGINTEEISLMIQEKDTNMIDYLKGFDISEYVNLSEWNKSVILRNKTEENISRLEYREVFYYYLNKCGYSVSSADYCLDAIDEYEKPSISYDDTIEIDDSQKEELEKRIIEGDTINDEEKASLNKYYFLKKLGDYKYLLELHHNKGILYNILWNEKHTGRLRLNNIIDELRFNDTKSYALNQLNKYDSYLELLSDKPLKIRAIKQLHDIFKDKIYNADEFRAILKNKETFDKLKQIFKIFNIVVDNDINNMPNVYYAKKIESIVDGWCYDTFKNVVDCKKGARGKQHKVYSHQLLKGKLRNIFNTPKPIIEYDEYDIVDMVDNGEISHLNGCLIVDE
jgi:hypothetical protein